MVPTADSTTGSVSRRTATTSSSAAALRGALAAAVAGTLGSNFPASQSSATTTPALKPSSTNARLAQRIHTFQEFFGMAIFQPFS